MKLSLLEKITIGWGIPINTIGYVYVNHTDIAQTASYYWNYKLKKYEDLVDDIKNSRDVSEKIEKFMPLLCYRFMVKSELKRTEGSSNLNHKELCKKYNI